MLLFFIADYHALTTHDDPTRLHENVRTVLAEYLAAGIDPDVATVYVQSDVPQVTELSLLLGMHAYVGELERTASFKDKVRKESLERQCRPAHLSRADGGGHSPPPRHACARGQGPGAAPRTDARIRPPFQQHVRR